MRAISVLYGILTMVSSPVTLKMSVLSMNYRPKGQGQALVEYLLMTLMLLFMFTTLYRVLQGQLKTTFQQVGRAILTAYY